jgi:hypothetical protein
VAARRHAPLPQDGAGSKTSIGVIRLSRTVLCGSELDVPDPVERGREPCAVVLQVIERQCEKSFDTLAQLAISPFEGRVDLGIRACHTCRIIDAPVRTQDGAQICGTGFTCSIGAPAATANLYPIIFGDINAAYTIVDRFDIRILRDPFSSKPHIEFYVTRRVGGQVVLAEAIRKQQVAA